MIGLPSTQIDDPAKKVLEAVMPGSVILFGRNIINRVQVEEFIREITKFLGYKPLIAIDQEGGIVTRLTDGFSVSPGAMGLHAAGNPDNARTVGRILGSEMKAVGIDWNLAPVVDINNNHSNPAIGVRSFSDNKDTVIDYASKFIEGLKETGIITCLKHFPGNGRVITDPHIDMPVLNISRDEIYKTELTPFMTIDAPVWMPTHIYVPAIQTLKEPITVSREILTDMIRNELGYDGVLLADDLNMGGVSNFYPPEDLALKTLEAGMDMISFCDNSEKQIQVKKFLDEKVSGSDELYDRISHAAARIEELFVKRNSNNFPGNRNTNFESNKLVMARISSQSVQIQKDNNAIFPLDRADNIFAVKMSQLVQIEENPGSIPGVVTKTGNFFKCPVTIYSREMSNEESASMLKSGAGKLNIIFTENAHLVSLQIEFIKELAKISDQLVLVALRNPYDGEIQGVENVICSFGYNQSQQDEILEKLIAERIKNKIE